jgi:cyclase
MQIEQLESDLYVLIGEAYHANSTALCNGNEVLLVDGMASVEDALELRHWIENDLHKRVRWIISTHYFSDHMAAFRLFPDSDLIAHKNYEHTFQLERFRSAAETEHFRKPTLTLDGELELTWGRFHLNIFPNPGHTMSTINVDVPEADLLLAGDTAVGNIVYFLYSAPSLITNALTQLLRRNRSRLIEGHGWVRPGKTVEYSLHYLRSLETNVRELRKHGDANAIPQIALADCLSKEVEPTDFEEIFHKRNLDAVIERGLF